MGKVAERWDANKKAIFRIRERVGVPTECFNSQDLEQGLEIYNSLGLKPFKVPTKPKNIINI